MGSRRAFVCLASCVLAVAPAQAGAPARVDGAGFREDVLKRFDGRLGGDRIVFDDDFILELRSPANGQSVYVNFHFAHDKCVRAPDDCADHVDAVIGYIAGDLAAARTVRDARDANDDSLVDFYPGARRTEELVARVKDGAQLFAGDGTAKGAPPAEIPLQPDAFTAYVRGRVQAYSTREVVALSRRYLITIGQDLALSAKMSQNTDESWTLNLLRRHCAAAPGDCDRRVSEFVQIIAGDLALADGTIDRAAFRAFLAPSVLQAPGVVVSKQQMRSFMDMFREPFGKFYEVCEPVEASRRLMRPDLDVLHMSMDEVFARCEANTRNVLGPLGDAYGAALPADGIGMVKGSSYESARLLFPDEFAALSRSLGGLLIAAPAQSMIVYSRDGGPAAAALLAKRARAMQAQAGNAALSASVLRWSKDGWQIAPAGE
jgi:hypothetical protein